jgi:streptogramin lyase
VAVDGNDNLWYANSTGNSVTLFKNLGTAAINGGQYTTVTSAISPSTGYTAGGTLSSPAQIAVDPSGDVWVTNTGASGVGPSVTELIGVAAPTFTPLSSAAYNNKLGAKP